MLTFVIQSHRGVEQLVARRAHNPEAGGSSPSPATRIRILRNQRPFFYVHIPHSPTQERDFINPKCVGII